MKNMISVFLILIVIQGCSSVKLEPEVKDPVRVKYDVMGTVDIVLTGDIMFGRRLEPLVEEFGVHYPVEAISESINTAPIVFGNLESPFVYEKNVAALKENGKKSVYLYAEENMAKSFRVAGYNVLSLANNHTLDYGQDGIRQTIEILENNKIKYGGIKIGDLGLPNEPVIMEYNGVKVGFLCYTRVSPKNFAASTDKYGTVPGTYKVIKRDIKNARSKADVLIVYMHWGLEGREVQKRQRVLGRGIIDLGADMVVGSHTHLFQDVEKYKGRYIFYGLGNFIFDMRDDPTKYSAFVNVRVENNKIKNAKITPVYLKDYRPEIINDKSEIDRFLKGIKLKDLIISEIYEKEAEK